MHEFQGHIQELKLGGNTNWGRGSGGRLEGPGQIHGGGPGGEAPGNSWISDILLTLKQVLIAENLQFFYIYIWSLYVRIYI